MLGMCSGQETHTAYQDWTADVMVIDDHCIYTSGGIKAPDRHEHEVRDYLLLKIANRLNTRKVVEWLPKGPVYASPDFAI